MLRVCGPCALTGVITAACWRSPKLRLPAITVPSLLPKRTFEHACGDTRRNVADRLSRIQLAHWLSPRGTVWQVTELKPEVAKCLKSLLIKPDPPILQIAWAG
jgi:hypothetical protein